MIKNSFQVEKDLGCLSRISFAGFRISSGELKNAYCLFSWRILLVKCKTLTVTSFFVRVSKASTFINFHKF